MPSKQKGFCRICGQIVEWSRGDRRDDTGVCSSECNQELKWRRSLSVCNREYYPEHDHTMDNLASLQRVNPVKNISNLQGPCPLEYDDNGRIKTDEN